MFKQTEMYLDENENTVCFYDTMAYLFFKYNLVLPF